MKKIIITFLVYTTILAGASSSTARGIVEDFSQLKYKVAMATRTSNPPVIDGIIDETVWDEAKLINEFLQFEPYNLEAPTVRTETRVLYDNEYLYIAFNNFDPNPDKIMARISRRDEWDFISDWVGFGIDSNNDEKTGYWFQLTAAEVQLDAAISEGRGRDGYDLMWNAVWDGKVSIHSDGWSAEIRIPFNVFQYKDGSTQIWGATFQRGYYGNQEEIQWPGRAKGVRGYIPYFGVIQGIKNIPQPKNLELVPYVLTGQTESDATDKVTDMGLDARYNINSSTALNMTFNPDFGQVQADPSVLNLSAFETRLKERRPFFVQGSSFFKSHLNLFNSRRIGKRPGFFSPESGTIIDRPNETTILGAVKILGESSSGLRYGVINAITNQEYGTREHDENGTLKKEKFLIEPYSNYFVGKLEKSIINDLSTVGFMATDLRRQKVENLASSFNLDWLINLMDNKFEFQGQVASTINDKNGYAGRFRISYHDPVWWEVMTAVGFRDKNWDVSDMGFQEKNNNWYSYARVSIRRDQPKGIFLSQNLEARLWVNGLLSTGLITGNNFEIKQRNNFKNYWNMGWEIEYNPEVYEDDDIYRDSRAMIIKDEAWQSFNIYFSTDKRKKVIVRPWYKIDQGEVRGIGRKYGGEITLKPSDFVNLSINTSKEIRPGSMQWVGIVEDENGANIIYSNTKRKQTETEIRLNIAFSSRMTFQAYYQPFEVEMDYKDYNRLLAEKTFNVSPYQYNENKDFRINNQVGTFVLRWEYLPGSLIYAVYKLQDNNYYSYEELSWSRSKSNSFFLKVDYFFQY
ncbi:MAG: DUF5916 domain-containing protein [Candidatus Marinimicrobia bacterium]|jgi:hypothetical protein|nr:DUF5916 domain-containing protein [Candidatus Neomarinimicrobiota bacterium]MDP6611292.1 DUF5916 domain-containing protein [Candidatus Neomarinimicrobiota bacterium]|tara:strand:+ start:24338 stop:26740 length:2403 start_codon:yes stop_codon:yes gene_type:complete